ncbi:hypothetical protein SUGI_0919290 [Cryptomeria japonica]|nr:hypothetical protein SUGI_0919290 [Cryptomeria japonica]
MFTAQTMKVQKVGKREDQVLVTEGLGSHPPSCKSKCGSCVPCEAVFGPFPREGISQKWSIIQKLGSANVGIKSMRLDFRSLPLSYPILMLVCSNLL